MHFTADMYASRSEWVSEPHSFLILSFPPQDEDALLCLPSAREEKVVTSSKVIIKRQSHVETIVEISRSLDVQL